MELVLCGNPVSVKSGDPGLMERVLAFMAGTFAFSSPGGQTVAEPLTWHIDSTPPPAGTPDSKPVFDSPTLVVWKTKNGFRLQSGDSAVLLDTKAGVAQAHILPSFWESELRPARELFQISMLMLLHPRGKWGLHAVGLSADDHGLLLIGDSGAGKTTTALALIREGWNYLSDDALCISLEDSGAVTAHAFRRGFSPTDEGWKALGSDNTPSDSGSRIAPGKWLVDLESSHEKQHVDTCVPTVVAFPLISKATESRATRVSPGNGLARMIPQCAGITADREQSARQMNMLGSLSNQVQFYDLHVGRDVFEEPKKVSFLMKSLAGGTYE